MAITHTKIGARIERPVPGSIRLATYLAVWLLAVVAFQGFLEPAGATATGRSELQQRILWPLYAPVMASVGLAQAITMSSAVSEWKTTAAGVALFIIGVLALTRTRRLSFAMLIAIHAGTLLVAVIYFVRFSRLSDSG